MFIYCYFKGTQTFHIASVELNISPKQVKLKDVHIWRFFNYTFLISNPKTERTTVKIAKKKVKIKICLASQNNWFLTKFQIYYRPFKDRETIARNTTILDKKNCGLFHI